MYGIVDVPQIVTFKILLKNNENMRYIIKSNKTVAHQMTLQNGVLKSTVNLAEAPGSRDHTYFDR